MLVMLDLDEDGNLIYNEVGNQQDGPARHSPATRAMCMAR